MPSPTSLDCAHTTRRCCGVIARVGAALLLTACGGVPVDDTFPDVEHTRPLRLGAAPFSLAASLESARPAQQLRAGGDTAVRLRVQPRRFDHNESRLCGMIAARVRTPVPVQFGWPVDSSLPRLAVRVLDGAVRGVRFVVPGADARYVFEGFTHDGTRRVSANWPVMRMPPWPVPPDASDADVEAMVTPSPLVLDTLIASLVVEDAPRRLSANAGDSTIVREQAVLLLRELPVYHVDPWSACPEVTVAIPAVARVDQLVRVPVHAGDVITAHGRVTDGTVRLSFDEGAPVPETGERRSVPQAAITATQAGRVTLRVRVQVVPKAHDTQQVVFLKVRRSHP